MNPFPDRLQAGQLLARQLEAYAGRHDVVVLALPRGGVPVGYAIAARLESPLDVLLVGKLGVPGHEDMSLGAVSSRGVCVLRPEAIAMMDLPPELIETMAHAELRELRRRELAYRVLRPAMDVQGKVVIVADDGLATGASMLAAVKTLRHEHPAQIIVAVPVATADSIAELHDEADAVICLQVPDWFTSVGQWYEDFHQVSDSQVMDYLRRAAQWHIPQEAGVQEEILMQPSVAANAPGLGPA